VDDRIGFLGKARASFETRLYQWEGEDVIYLVQRSYFEGPKPVDSTMHEARWSAWTIGLARPKRAGPVEVPDWTEGLEFDQWEAAVVYIEEHRHAGRRNPVGTESSRMAAKAPHLPQNERKV